MSDEITIRASLQINKGNLKYRSFPTDYTTDISGEKGPVPGAMTATLAGADVDFSQLTSPGWCRIYNLSTTYTVIFGIRAGAVFYPLIDVKPGEFQLIELSQFLGDSFDTGTGTAVAGTGHAFCVKAIGTTCDVIVEGFER